MLTYNKIIIINFFLKNILSSKLKKKLNFKKQNELGKVIFIIDNTYYNKILINSSFKMTMPNQLGHTDNSNKDTSSRGTKRYKLLYVILFTLLCIIMLTYLFYFYLYSTDINNAIFLIVIRFFNLNVSEIKSACILRASPSLYVPLFQRVIEGRIKSTNK